MIFSRTFQMGDKVINLLSVTIEAAVVTQGKVSAAQDGWNPIALILGIKKSDIINKACDNTKKLPIYSIE